jgi:hypothetical protein
MIIKQKFLKYYFEGVKIDFEKHISIFVTNSFWNKFEG